MPEEWDRFKVDIDPGWELTTVRHVVHVPYARRIVEDGRIKAGLAIKVREENMSDISMYNASVPIFIKMLKNCTAILDKAKSHAASHGYDAQQLLRSRLYPDMFDLSRQVQIAADGARGCIMHLVGQPIPSERELDIAVFNRGDDSVFSKKLLTFSELVSHIQETVSYLEFVEPTHLNGSEDKRVVLTLRGKTRTFDGLPFLLHYALPNFYFHLSMAYAILRMSGVQLGKADYEGPPSYLSGVA